MLQMGISEDFVEMKFGSTDRTARTGTDACQRAAISNILLDVETGFVRRHTNQGAVLKVQVQ